MDNLVHYSGVKCPGAVCTGSKLSWRGAQQELTTATYLTAMKPPTVGHTTQHYPSKKNGIRTFIFSGQKCPQKTQRGEIFGVKIRPLARDGSAPCVVNWERSAS